MTPEEYKKKIIQNLTSFLREEKYYHWKLSDIQIIEAAIEAAYDAGKSSGDAPMKQTLENIGFCVERGYFNGKR